MELTDTQQAILALIAERIERDGVPPSQTEIAHACGFKGVRAAQYHLEALELAGRCGGRIRPVWHSDSEPSLVPGLGRFLHLTQGFEVRRADGTLLCTLVDDVTLLAPSPSKNSTNRARSGRRPPCGALEAHG